MIIKMWEITYKNCKIKKKEKVRENYKKWEIAKK